MRVTVRGGMVPSDASNSTPASLLRGLSVYTTFQTGSVIFVGFRVVNLEYQVVDSGTFAYLETDVFG
jgi:hypothetical protein